LQLWEIPPVAVPALPSPIGIHPLISPLLPPPPYPPLVTVPIFVSSLTDAIARLPLVSTARIPRDRPWLGMINPDHPLDLCLRFPLPRLSCSPEVPGIPSVAIFGGLEPPQPWETHPVADPGLLAPRSAPDHPLVCSPAPSPSSSTPLRCPSSNADNLTGFLCKPGLSCHPDLPQYPCNVG
jgi:hypothetical protein